MEDLVYKRKFDEMQKYIPFLERVIDKLKNNEQPRKAQLEKMQMLYNLLNNKQKKLSIETLLKCESVLMKLRTKIEKADDLCPPKSISNPSTSSAVPNKVQPTVYKSTSAHFTSPTASEKFIVKKGSNLIEINTCPASPVQFVDEDFIPPVEIPMERRCSPLRLTPSTATTNKSCEPGKPIPTLSSTRYESSSDFYYSSNIKYQQQQPATERVKSRWSDASDWTTPETPSAVPSSTSSAFQKSWSPSSSATPASSSNYRPQQRNEQPRKVSSEEENWDDPEDEKPPPPPTNTYSKPPSSSSSSSAAYSHNHHRDSGSNHHHRHHEKSSKHSRDSQPQHSASFTQSPEINTDKDAFQNKLYHDTIYKYKKPDPPTGGSFNPFMNPPPPESVAPPPQPGNIFHRLGEKVDSFENFRIEVKNDKMKPKPAKPTPTPAIVPLVPIKPIDEVLKSPPLSADDIDDLLNESLEEAIGKSTKPKPILLAKESKSSALELVRKKLAMISNPPKRELESPPLENTDEDQREPFYRRGHTPVKKLPENVVKLSTSPVSHQRELFKPPPLLLKSYPETSSNSPPNPIDPVIERLALKYHPHRRRDSISAMSRDISTYSQHQSSRQTPAEPPVKDITIDTMADRLALKYNPHPRRNSTTSPLRTVDPRVGKMLGQISPLVTSPSPIAVSPVANVTPTLNTYDPRLRNARLPSVDSNAFCTPIPPYAANIPSLFDINVPMPLNKHGYGLPIPSRMDPRAHKPQATVYAEKFNPERNDQTERMKYLESKRNKPPEPKTYGEYKQSKSRQKAAEIITKAADPVVEPIPVVTSVLSATPSTLDKIYRNADYGKELGGSIQGFKIPKKTKPEEPKGLEVKKEVDEEIMPKKLDEPEKKQEEPAIKSEKPIQKSAEPAKKLEEPSAKSDEPVKKLEQPIKKLEQPTKKHEQPIKKLEQPIKKLEQPTKKLAEPIKKLDEPLKKPNKTIYITKGHNQSPLRLNESLKCIEIEPPDLTQESTGSLDESKSEDALVIDEAAEEPPKPIVSSGRRPGRPKGSTEKKKHLKEDSDEDSVISEPPESPKPIAQSGRRPGRPKGTPDKRKQLKGDTDEESEEEIKPRRIATRRMTTLKDPPKNRCSETPSPPRTRCRSASDMFPPNTDNSVISTDNIISGKRKTRSTINFNEKTTKKPVTPKAPPASPVTPTKGKAGPKPGAKKCTAMAIRSRRNTCVRQALDDGQNCSVSSTTSQSGDSYISRKEDLTKEKVESSEEPSSSGLKQQTSTVDADENQKKQEWLEGFLKSIVDPTTNKERILDMLKAVLDEKKLQQVKDILYSPEDEGTKDEDTHVNAKKPLEQNKPRATRTKKNELDRLNEDIRDMFICQGVVTATGRRMCTLAKETAKPKVDNLKEKKTRLKGDATPSPTHLSKRGMRQAKVVISPLNMRSLRSRTQKGGVTPKMPVLEPNTPIKLPEEVDDDLETLERPNKNSKRKCVPSLELDSDDDDIELVHLKKKIKDDDTKDEEKEKQEEKTEMSKEDEKEEEPKKIEELEEKPKEVEIKANTEEVEKEAEPQKEEKKAEEPTTKIVETVKETLVAEVPLKKEPPKNTNPDWHSMSEFAACCVICKDKSRYIAPHYLTAHNDSEVYTSRLPPTVLQDIKRNVGNRALYSMPKKPNLTIFHYRCPFCDFQATNALRGWLDHITIHTGEYQFKCSACFRGMNGCSNLSEHMKKCSPNATKISREYVSLRGHAIKAYLCHLCNFIQILHSGVVRHLKTQHGVEDSESIAAIIEVKLLDTVGVPRIEDAEDSDDEILAPPPPPCKPKPVELKPSSESNMEVFLSRDLASPTSDVLTERLKSIDQDDGLTSDSSVNTVSPFKDGQAPEARMTIAEKLTQRFKTITQQNDARAEDEEESIATQKDLSTPMVIDETPPPEATIPPLPLPPPICSSADSFNDSGNLVIDEQEDDKSAVEDDVTDSEWADDNEEDDNENWEDIEITETKGTSQKDKNKNKSIFNTLTRLYAAIAPKKGSKKAKETEKKKPEQPAIVPPPPPPAAPPSIVAAQPRPPQQISNLSDLLPDSPSDSLDMLLATNFNCLEGDGTSFPHLDLNDLDSPIFLLSEEQTNLQDAIAMATDTDQVKYDVLGEPLPAVSVQPQLQLSSSKTVQRVGNFGFYLSGESLKYYCMVTACTFLFSDHPDGLQNHFLLEHPMLKWNGYCHTCKSQVQPEGGREMQHMLDVHSKPKTGEPPSGDKPRITFRRLTGDILSTGKLESPPVAQLTPPSPGPSVAKEPEAKTSQLCLSTMLQSQPRAMTQPTPPPAFQTDIPLYKNVSKEFPITSVAEGVLNQADCGMQISQVISLNAGGKSVSAASLSLAPEPTLEHRLNSPSRREILPTPSPIQINAPLISPLNQSLSGATTSQRKITPPKPPAFKCCATNCTFFTNLRSAMNEHLLFHVRTGNDRGSLKCHECDFAGRSIYDYFQHMSNAMSNGHSNVVQKSSPHTTTNELTQKIQDILRATSTTGKSSEEEERDPLELDSFVQRLRLIAEEIVECTGMSDEDVWKCPISNDCGQQITENSFLTHVATHLNAPINRVTSTPLKCPHCSVMYSRPAILKAHIKSHSRHQYFCYVCSATFVNYQQSQKHFAESHSGVQSQSQLLIPVETPELKPFYIVSFETLSDMQVIQFGEKLIADCERKKSLNKTHFQPHEQNLLPLQPIFNNQVFCSACHYKTKVRTNMYRHLQLHKQEMDVASVDPVNPVPCLEKNVKHFDKMLNLACSSNATGSGKARENTGSVKIPIFVPDMRRYVCGHPGCTYLTITDQMLRSHLNALHSGEKGYRCPHCKEDICKKTMCAERVVQHLKFHGPKIYQCGECEYLHYTKHVVERHVHDKHAAVASVNLISYDRANGEVNKTSQPILGKNVPHAASSTETTNSSGPSPHTSSTTPTANKFKWECAICKFQSMKAQQMVAHATSAHNSRHQYHCVHCTHGASLLSNIMDHIDTKHPTKTREAKYVFYKINETPQDKAADTRPLWSRDDPKRVRNIRGILMENEEDAERTKQSLSNAGVDLDDDDDDVEIVQVIESDTAMKPGVFGCFHCEYKSEDMTALTTHWKTKHWHMKNQELVPKLPFFFRIHSILKCPMCSYVGDYVFLQKHAANSHGQRAFCAADPILPNTCGHCPFVYPSKRLEILTRHYHREHKPTDVKNLSSALLKSVLTLGDCQVYMQCYFCAEICADKTAIIDHERERHGSSNFRYKQIKDEVIYRCGMCQYSSTNEMATLRHMVDHFGGFKHCHFCLESQTNFNSYMQHCYANHLSQLKEFKDIYTLSDMTAFLGQMLLIFPNGLIVNKRNLMHTQYGSTERISAMYDEICKKALEPPIPPLCMAQLIAKRSSEAKQSAPHQPLLPPPPVPVTAKRIAKRRSTVASSAIDRDCTAAPVPQKIRKRKASVSEYRPAPAPTTPLFSKTPAPRENEVKNTTAAVGRITKGVSFYGKQPKPIDLTKIYTHIPLGDKYAPVSVAKFNRLFKMNARVVVVKMDLGKTTTITDRPCPASKKKRLEIL